MSQFETAATNIKASADRNVKMSNDELLQVYSLYKQANVGDNNTDKPGMLSFEAKAKWEAWNKQKGKSQEDAKKEYIDLAKNLLIKYKCDDLANF